MADAQTMTARQALELAKAATREIDERQPEIDEVVAVLRRLRTEDRLSEQISAVIREGWRK